MHIPGSLNVPRGILESACEWDYEETLPELVRARRREVVLVCRSGRRSVLAAHSLQILGFQRVASLQTGLRGWKDYEQALEDDDGDCVDHHQADGQRGVDDRAVDDPVDVVQSVAQDRDSGGGGNPTMEPKTRYSR
jgi:rhodanese-related sulfurtransferase